MTIDYSPKSGWATYDMCGKPAKYRTPESKMGVEYVCGIHANSLDKMYKRIGSDLKCIPLDHLL
jgi:hypothetical protein